eukprot:snap_masked-scaffold_77-processed-gene-0.35-mRNA-1 protein AED:0.23 eAED:0.23 QI:0/-1/0/1/-1/1/1/0/126
MKFQRIFRQLKRSFSRDVENKLESLFEQSALNRKRATESSFIEFNPENYGATELLTKKDETAIQEFKKAGMEEHVLDEIKIYLGSLNEKKRLTVDWMSDTRLTQKEAVEKTASFVGLKTTSPQEDK